MRLPDLALTGWTEICAHKMRSFLSFFAIAIGIATFFYTLSILSQKYKDINRIAETAGTGRIDTETRHPLTMKQYYEIKKRLPENSSLSFVTQPEELYTWRTLNYKGNEITGASMIGVLPDWKNSNFPYRLEGRFLNWQDIENRHKVMLITVFPREKEQNIRRRVLTIHNKKENIYLHDFTNRHHLLNQTVTMNNQQYTVIGLLHVPPEQTDPRLPIEKDWHMTIFMPYTTWYDAFSQENDNRKTYIRALTGNESTTDDAATAIYSYLRSQFGINEKPEIKFFHEEMQNRMRSARKSLNSMLFMGIIAMIAGGIGIMNVTMAVISSRTKEIGIRRALGASRKDILFQFLIEAMLLGLCGSIAGMILGYMALLHMAETTSQMTFSWWVIAGSIIIGLFTSFLFALYPAWQAANLNPADALKKE
ncbi:MAG: ABC transporter permease [Elusimicrobiales bacterium]|nr:ABC transporter permease [Elusimicrobiales bacterium]